MERESFENREIAQLLNREYICVKVDREESVLQTAINEAREQLTEAQKQLIPAARWVLRGTAKNDTPALRQALHRFMQQHRGPVPVLLYYPHTDTKLLEPSSRWMNSAPATRQGLAELLGADNVVLQSLKN